MRKELDERLCKKYPKIFRQRHRPMTETCMCWGFECGDGWYNIINALCGMIQWHIDQKNKEVARNKWYQRKIVRGQIDEIPQWWLNKYREHGVLTFKPEDTTRFPQTEVVQVKEKFGTLRFYTGGGYDDVIGAYIAFAENLTALTCEECGAPGKLRRGGWVRCLCDEHAKDREPEDE